ncbi:hypothetical protein QQF64_000201 [Cirrhinus molitorella]|uniref:Immunoglobulin V-set domain-containing protein n=1 Tax=Cirrhinus molitorella TaxID=172907 RepID=A0ABR3NWJ2_9TELE
MFSERRRSQVVSRMNGMWRRMCFLVIWGGTTPERGSLDGLFFREREAWQQMLETVQVEWDGDSLETIRDDRFSFSDEASTGVFTVNITDLREEDSGIYWCGAPVITKVYLNFRKNKDRNFSMIIIIIVCVILLLIGGFTLTVWKLRHKRRVPGSGQMNSNGDRSTPSLMGPYAAVSFRSIEELSDDAASQISVVLVGGASKLLYTDEALNKEE